MTINYVIDTDPDVLVQDALDYIAANVPGWVPADADLEVWIIEACARIASEVRDVAADVPVAVFRYFGQLVNIVSIQDTSATFLVNFTAQDTNGYTIPVGTAISLRNSVGQLIPFITTTPVSIPFGSSTVTGVTVVASVPGSYANNVTLTGNLAMIDALTFITAVAPTSGYTLSGGGTDEETDGTFMNRLSTELTFMAPRPILPADFSHFALEIPGVGRALTVDLFNPADNSTANERMVTVFITDAFGVVCSAPVKAAVDADLQARREVNTVVNIADPEYTNVDTTVVVVKQIGFTNSDVQASIIATLQTMFDDAVWGLQTTSTAEDNVTTWVQRGTVYLYDVATAIRNVPGVDHITTLTLGKNGGAQSAANVTLGTVAAKAQLTHYGVTSVTVS